MNSRKHKWCTGTAILFLLGFSDARPEWVEWVLEPGIEYRHEDNLNLSSFKEDEESDQALRPWLSGGRFYQMGDHTRLRLVADLEFEFFDEFDGLNSLSIAGTSAITHKFGLGRTAPWIRPYLTLGYKDIDVDIRSGWFYNIGLAVGKRFTDRLDFSASIEYQDRDGKDGVLIVPGIPSNVFDQNRFVFSLTGNFLLSDRWYLSGRLAHFDGDFDSACTPWNVGEVLASGEVTAITLDDVFGGCVYRLNGKGNSGSLDLSFATSRHSSLNLGVKYLKGKAGTLKYRNTVIRASFIYSF